MNKHQLERKPLARWVAFALAATTAAGVAQAAAPLAGTEIKNLATVSYEDGEGNTYTAQSNEAIITVAPQYRATLEGDKDLTGAPGSTVYFPHTITNEGNIADTYTLTTDVTAGVKIFNDENGNGQPDSGELEITELSVGAGETGNIVVAYTIPGTAQADDVTTVVLTAASTKTGAQVIDTGVNFDVATDPSTDVGADNSATNHDKLTVVAGPVLVLNKEATINEADNTITYTLTVKNTGSETATGVDILDALPMVDTNGDGTADTQVTVIESSPGVTVTTNGLLDAGDTAGSVKTESAFGDDVDGDGDTSADVNIIHAQDLSLASGTTVSISYVVAYDETWAAGADVDNTFKTVHTDPTNPGTPVTTTSNTTHNDVPQMHGVDADDDGDIVNTDVAANDGRDDDLTPGNDTQQVASASAGAEVLFTHTITNNGNGDDTLNLKVANTDFPAGTVFTLWNADGTVQLTDSDGDGVPDTGVVGAGEEISVVVKANLPSGVSQSTPSNAVLTATSSGDSTEADTANLLLSEITAPKVDLASASTTPGHADTGFKDDGTVNAHNEGPVVSESGVVGGVVSFPMKIANEAGSADSFVLSAAGVPDDWSVVFKDSTGAVITATPFIPADSTFEYTAEVTISDDPALAVGSSKRAGDAGIDGVDALDDDGATTALSGGDGDNDYKISIVVTSAVDDTRSDAVDVSVDVADIESVTITPDGQNQIQPGGTVDYPHKLTNSGNVDEAVELTATNTDSDWSSTTLVENSDGALVDIATLEEGDEVKVTNPDGSTVNVAVEDEDEDGIVEFPLEPGQYINVTDKVFAPSDAAQGVVNTTTLTATDPDDGSVPGAVRNVATDSSTVILGQVRLDKTSALDIDCNGEADDPGTFAAIQTSKVEPGQCVVWQIVAKNEGDALVKNVVVSDAVPAYTAFLNGSLRRITTDTSGTVTTDTLSDSEANDEGEVNSVGKVTFYLGTGSDSTATPPVGGELKSGESETVRFSVEVDGNETTPAPI